MIYLSYPLSEKTPLYGGEKGVTLFQDRKQSEGASCNTMNWSFPNHAGTHIDAPYHFDSSGKQLCDYPPEFWIFDTV